MGTIKGVWAIGAALIMSACSNATPPAPSTAVETKVDTLEMYLSKRTVKDTEFEQYTLDSGKLFRECGKIRRGRFVQEHQDLIDLSPEQAEEINLQAAALLGALKTSKSTFESPGTNATLWDPGQLTLNVHFSQPQNADQTIKTSLDSIATPEKITQDELKKFAMVIREAGAGKLCANPTFFGLSSTAGREAP